jgi:uncharacterized protein
MNARTSSFRLRPFRPAWWLPGPHAQTVMGKFLRPVPGIPLHRTRIETPDGDFVDLDFAREPRPDAPVALVLHGLEGSISRPYALLTFEALLAEGIRPVGFNFRSCSGEPNRTARFYHSGDTEDLACVLDHLARRFPGRRIGAIGFSLGGNVLLKYLGEREEWATQHVQAAATVSVPFDLAGGTTVMESGIMGRVYSYYFIRSLLQKAELKAGLLEGKVDLKSVRAARSLREFDDAATAPLHGFTDAAEYYHRSSSMHFLERVRVPTLLLQSKDDPFLPAGSLPLGSVARNPHLFPGFTETGGHVGFVEGPGPWAPSFWAEREAARFLAVQLDLGASSQRAVRDRR